jgi:hypothetical protein
MGQPVKFTDQEKEWFLRKSRCKNRILEARLERERFLIVCEGEKTEPNYFKAFIKELPPHVVDVVILGEGMNTLSLVDTAMNKRDQHAISGNSFDHIWVVFDRDSFQADDYDNAIHKAQAAEIECAWSNEAFELWFILHFEFRNTGMSRDEYKGKLSQLLDRTYVKNSEDMYLTLSRIGNQTQAIAWAKTLSNNFSERTIPPSRSNPCTTVYLLVEKLNEYKTPINLE